MKPSITGWVMVGAFPPRSRAPATRVARPARSPQGKRRTLRLAVARQPAASRGELKGFEHAPALADGAPEEASGQGCRHQQADRHRAGRLAEDRDSIRVAAEGRDVALHPIQSRDLVQEPIVSRPMATRLGGEFGQGKEAERAQPVTKGDDDHVVAGELIAPIERHRRRSI